MKLDNNKDVLMDFYRFRGKYLGGLIECTVESRL